MKLQYRIDLLSKLGEYMLGNHPDWQQVKEKAAYENGWFIPEFTELACTSIARSFLNGQLLKEWSKDSIADSKDAKPLSVGIVMAGNIPLVGFHDFLCVFICGHQSIIRLSSKDKVLLKHLAERLIEWEPLLKNQIRFSELLKGCDAYIATGSNNSSRYFEYYFGKYPNIIRRNRSSVAVLNGNETKEELEKLSDDVFQYFGLGCRNVTKLLVPKDYDFVPLLQAFDKYKHLADHHKYKNNYDYNLALHILNKKYYMTNGAILLVEDASLFSPISQLHYEQYENESRLNELLQNIKEDIQIITGKQWVPFGKAQSPQLTDYADGVNTLDFLLSLPSANS